MRNLTGGKRTVASVCVLVIVAAFFAAREALLVGAVSVEGAKAVSEADILKRIGFPASGGKVLLFPGAVSGAVGKDRWVKTVSVKRDFRGKISIKLEEKTPFCLLADPDGKMFYVDSSGETLGRAPVPAYGMDFPVLRSPAGFVADGAFVLGLSVSARSAPGWDDISEVVVSSGDGVEIFTRSGARVELGADLRAEWERLEKITRNLYALGLNAKYINLRRSGVGIVGLKRSGK